jgi:hypothetical protein
VKTVVPSNVGEAENNEVPTNVAVEEKAIERLIKALRLNVFVDTNFAVGQFT